MRNHRDCEWFLLSPSTGGRETLRRAAAACKAAFNNPREAFMTERIENVPGGTHPIFISHNPARVIVRLQGQVVADSKEALTLLEANYPAVQARMWI
jgi:hypothetical protein